MITVTLVAIAYDGIGHKGPPTDNHLLLTSVKQSWKGNTGVRLPSCTCNRRIERVVPDEAVGAHSPVAVRAPFSQARACFNDQHRGTDRPSPPMPDNIPDKKARAPEEKAFW